MKTLKLHFSVCNDETEGHDKGIKYEIPLDKINGAELATHCRLMVRSCLKAALLHDKYGWDVEDLQKHRPFLDDVGNEDRMPTEPSLESYRLTSWPK